MDTDFINGIETGIEIVRSIYELSTGERKQRFGSTSVPEILDKFDFAQIRNLMSIKKTLRKYYLIRGIKNVGHKKEVKWESDLLEGYPSDAMIQCYLEKNDADFAVVGEIYKTEITED